jgi:hypothetical protein
LPVWACRYTARQLHGPRAELSEPAHASKTDNFFLLIFRALRHRRVPIALRIASHNVILVALALVIYACVMGLQFKQAMHEQADALGESLTTQTATSATELLVSNDILSLNVLLNNLTKNPLVAHAAIYSVDNRILAEAGQRPKTACWAKPRAVPEQDHLPGRDRRATAHQPGHGAVPAADDHQPAEHGHSQRDPAGAGPGLEPAPGRHISTPLLQLRVWLRTSTNTPRPPTARTKSATSPASCTPASPRNRRRSPSQSRNSTTDDDEPSFEVRNLRDPGFDESRPVAG